MLTNLGHAQLTTDHPASIGDVPILVLTLTREALQPLEARQLLLISATATEYLELTRLGYHLTRGSHVATSPHDL